MTAPGSRPRASSIRPRAKKSAQEEIERERRAAAEELRSQVVALSMAAASKVIQKNLDEKANEHLIAEFAERLGQEKLGDFPC